MNIDWRRRTPNRPWLLVRPALDGSWDWLLLDGAGEGRQQGQGQPPAQPLAAVALIVPGEACSHFQLAAPPGLKREEWLLLLEDRLLQDAGDTHCACIARLPGQLRLVTLQARLLQQWQAQCTAWGLQVERCWSEFQLLAQPAPGTGWQWRHAHVELLVKADEDGSQHWLAWPQALGAAPSAFEALQLTSIDSRWPPVMADLARLPSLLKVRRSGWGLAVPRQHLRLLGVCALLAGLWAATWMTQQWRQAQVYREQVLAVTGPQGSLRQAAQALKRLGAADLEREVRLRQLDDLQQRLDRWLSEHPQYRLQAVRFDGRFWHLQVQGEGTALPWREMAEAVGVGVEAQQAGVVFDLGAAS